MAEHQASPEDEKARYDAAWKKYSIYRLCLVITCAGIILGFIFSTGLISIHLGERLGYDLLEFLCALWSATFVISAVIGKTFHCPRCHTRFFDSRFYRNLFSSKCLNCGLRKYTYDTGPQ